MRHLRKRPFSPDTHKWLLDTGMLDPIQGHEFIDVIHEAITAGISIVIPEGTLGEAMNWSSRKTLSSPRSSTTETASIPSTSSSPTPSVSSTSSSQGTPSTSSDGSDEDMPSSESAAKRHARVSALSRFLTNGANFGIEEYSNEQEQSKLYTKIHNMLSTSTLGDLLDFYDRLDQISKFAQEKSKLPNLHAENSYAALERSASETKIILLNRIKDVLFPIAQVHKRKEKSLSNNEGMKTLRYIWGLPTPESAAVVEQLNQRIQQDILCTSAMTPNSLQNIFPSTDKKQKLDPNDISYACKAVFSDSSAHTTPILISRNMRLGPQLLGQGRDIRASTNCDAYNKAASHRLALAWVGSLAVPRLVHACNPLTVTVNGFTAHYKEFDSSVPRTESTTVMLKKASPTPPKAQSLQASPAAATRKRPPNLPWSDPPLPRNRSDDSTRHGSPTRKKRRKPLLDVPSPTTNLAVTMAALNSPPPTAAPPAGRTPDGDVAMPPASPPKPPSSKKG